MGNVVEPFELGWWLTPYLFLVGGVAQLLLIRGQDALTAGAREPPASLARAQWHFGTPEPRSWPWPTWQFMAGVGVSAGGAALLVALVLYPGCSGNARGGHQHGLAAGGDYQLDPMARRRRCLHRGLHARFRLKEPSDDEASVL
jgi:hypothetical protein